MVTDTGGGHMSVVDPTTAAEYEVGDLLSWMPYPESIEGIKMRLNGEELAGSVPELDGKTAVYSA